MLENTPSQASNFRTKKWVEINNNSRGMYNPNSQIEFKTSLLRSSLFDYSDAYILGKGTISIAAQAREIQTILAEKQYLKTVLHLLIA